MGCLKSLGDRFRQRMNIALDVACGLGYLHHDCQVSIGHCDLKLGNFLRENDMVGHVEDFGLSRFLAQPSILKSE